jgi:hypothetical protein
MLHGVLLQHTLPELCTPARGPWRGALGGGAQCPEHCLLDDDLVGLAGCQPALDNGAAVMAPSARCSGSSTRTASSSPRVPTTVHSSVMHCTAWDIAFAPASAQAHSCLRRNTLSMRGGVVGGGGGHVCIAQATPVAIEEALNAPGQRAKVVLLRQRRRGAAPDAVLRCPPCQWSRRSTQRAKRNSTVWAALSLVFPARRLRSSPTVLPQERWALSGMSSMVCTDGNDTKLPSLSSARAKAQGSALSSNLGTQKAFLFWAPPRVVRFLCSRASPAPPFPPPQPPLPQLPCEGLAPFHCSL